MRKTLAADQAITTTLALLSGLGVPVTAGKITKFRFVLDVVVGAAVDGVLMLPDGPALTRLNYYTKTPTSIAASVESHGNTSWKGASTTATPPTTSPATLSGVHIIEGEVTPSADGFINVWGIIEASPTGSPLLKKGSYCEFNEIA